mgnify:CR=1 FL=1
MKLTDKEISSMLAQSPEVRYSYSLKRIADSGCLWYMSSDDSYMCIQAGDIRLFPVWPFKEYAEKFVSSMSNGHKCNCSKLNLEEFSKEGNSEITDEFFYTRTRMYSHEVTNHDKQ